MADSAQAQEEAAPAVDSLRMSSFGNAPPSEELAPAVPGEARDVQPGREELVMLSNPRSAVAEQFRRLRNSIQAMNPDGASRVVLLTSAVDGEGKSVSTLNLGLAITELPHMRVCVIDANLVNPALEELLDLPRRQGMSEVLKGKLSLEAATRATSIERFDIIGAGAAADDFSLNVDRMRSLLNALKRQYDYVLIDAPSVLSANQPSLLASIADGILLVVRMGKTSKQEVEEAFTMLEGLGGNVLGTCATSVEG